MNKVIARGRQYYEDSQGNLILAIYVKESPVKVRGPKDLFPYLTEERTDCQENMIVFTLDGHNQVINKNVISRGIANQCQVHPREVFKPAIADHAVSILICHNHPSGNTEPSEADIVATKRMFEVSQLVGIALLDHIIVTAMDFLSIRELRPGLFSLTGGY